MSSGFRKDRTQIESRKFQLEYPVEAVRDYLACTNRLAVDDFIRSCNMAASQGRFYTRVASVGTVDSVYVLEAMGLGRYSYEYQVIFDFSDKLDYYLHKITGCSSEAVRELPNYNEVSYAVLNNDYSRIPNTSFDALIKLDRYIGNYFISLMVKAQERGLLGDAACTKDVTYQFYTQLLSTMSDDRDYLITSLRSKFRGRNFVYRSKNLSSAVVSAEFPFEEEITLKQESYEDCIIQPHCYKRYEYAEREVFVCADCRKCQHWK